MKTDAEYIEEAVKLADGFEIADTWIWHINGTPHRFPAVNKPPQYLLDSLAAQLVRQVDDKKGFRIEIYERSSGIYQTNLPPSVSSLVKVVSGKGRAMNTIRAIAASKVLT